MSIPVSGVVTLLPLEELAGTAVTADPCGCTGRWVPRTAVLQKVCVSLLWTRCLYPLKFHMLKP